MRRVASLLAICACALSAQTKKIVVDNSEGLVQELAGVSPKAHIVPVNAENVMREIGDADAYVGDITPEQVRAGKRLQWVQVMSAGVEHVLFRSGANALRDSNIVLTNNKIVQGPEIADHAMAMLLMLSRRLRVIMDPDLGRYATVWAAAGLPTAVFPVSPDALRMLSDAHVAPIAEASEVVEPPAAEPPA